MQNVPVWIVGNKVDLCMNVLATLRSHRQDHHHFIHAHHDSPYNDLVPAFKDLSNLIRKQWKCNYIECSVKYNWHVTPIFREIIKSLDVTLPLGGEPPFPPYTDNQRTNVGPRENHLPTGGHLRVTTNNDASTFRSTFQTKSDYHSDENRTNKMCTIS